MLTSRRCILSFTCLPYIYWVWGYLELCIAAFAIHNTLRAPDRRYKIMYQRRQLNSIETERSPPRYKYFWWSPYKPQQSFAHCNSLSHTNHHTVQPINDKPKVDQDASHKVGPGRPRHCDQKVHASTNMHTAGRREGMQKNRYCPICHERVPRQQ